MADYDMIDFTRTLTNKLNQFFGQLSAHKYQFENVSESKKQEEIKKQKALRKAFRIFKKSLKLDDREDLNEKEKEAAYEKEWERLEEVVKMKYLDNGKVVEKKPKKKKDDDAFQPGIDK